MHSLTTCLVLLSTCILFTKGQRTCDKLTFVNDPVDKLEPDGPVKFVSNDFEWNEWDQDCNRDDQEALCKNALVTKSTQQGESSAQQPFGWAQDKSLYTISACYAYVVTADTTLKIRKKPGGKNNFQGFKIMKRNLSKGNC